MRISIALELLEGETVNQGLLEKAKQLLRNCLV
jgi:hypothetical protein